VDNPVKTAIGFPNFFTLLTLLFAYFKLSGSDMSWWVVFLPMFVQVGFLMAIGIATLVAATSIRKALNGVYRPNPTEPEEGEDF
jgi:hypothetical protein